MPALMQISLIVSATIVGLVTTVSALESPIVQDHLVMKSATYREDGWRSAQNKGDMNGLKDRMKAGDNSVETKDRMKAGDNSVETKDRMKAGDNSVGTKDRMKAGDNSVETKDRIK
jgi:hypothetical protein